MSVHGPVPLELLGVSLSERIQRFVTRVGRELASESGRSWVFAADADTRRLGFAILGELAEDDDSARYELLAAARYGCGDLVADVRREVAKQLGDLGESEPATELLATLLDDEVVDVRAQAALELAHTLPNQPGSMHPVVQILVGLLDDESEKVRDWTAFVLGTQLDVDFPKLRDKLLEMAGTDLDRNDVYPAVEAAVGVARRGDLRLLPILRQRIDGLSTGRLWFQAAAMLGSHKIHDRLLALRAEAEGTPRGPWDDGLDEAIACTAPVGRKAYDGSRW